MVEREDGQMVALHIITTPGLMQPNGRFQIISLEAFGNRMLEMKFGKSNEHAARMKPVSRWFSVNRHDDWLADRERDMQSMVRCGIHDFVPEHAGVPTIHHSSVWSFYEAVGWDKKKRRLV